jgi:ankyrin repeat protein
MIIKNDNELIKEYALKTKGIRFLTKISKPKSEIKPRKTTLLAYTHLLTRKYPGKPNMAVVKAYVQFNNVIGINDGEPSTSVRATSGTTALMHAALYGFDELVSYYIELGANPFSVNENGFMAIDFARKHKHEKCINILEAVSKKRWGY